MLYRIHSVSWLLYLVNSSHETCTVTWQPIGPLPHVGKIPLQHHIGMQRSVHAGASYVMKLKVVWQHTALHSKQC